MQYKVFTKNKGTALRTTLFRMYITELKCARNIFCLLKLVFVIIFKLGKSF